MTGGCWCVRDQNGIVAYNMTQAEAERVAAGAGLQATVTDLALVPVRQAKALRQVENPGWRFPKDEILRTLKAHGVTVRNGMCVIQ